MRVSIITVLLLLPVSLLAVPCTDSTPNPNTPTAAPTTAAPTTAAPTTAAPTTEAPTTAAPTTAAPTTEAPTTAAPTTEAPTTEYVPPPRSFPRGTYALPKPAAGCPWGGFKTFWYYQDTEDYYNVNRWPETMGMQSVMKRDGFKMFMCVKSDETKGGNYAFPAGDYCIVKLGECPAGFDVGSITWDDENSNNANSKKAGVRPDGAFGADTTIEYCCRNDGSATTAVKLPINRSYYLMRYTSQCQAVAEMNVKEEVISWDDEDTGNTNSKSGAHPMDTGNAANHKLHYCLYEPIAA